MTMTPEQQQSINKEIEYYKSIIGKMPKSSPFSINAHLKLGKLYLELGEKDTALNEYVTAAVQYTHSGELVKALAVNKMIIGLQPTQEIVSKALAGLSSLYFQHEEQREYVAADNKKTSPQLLDVHTNTSSPSLDLLQQNKISGIDAGDAQKEDYAEEAEIASYLKQNPLFQCLSWAERQWVEENVVVYHFAKNTTILQKGHEQESLFVLLEGYVKIRIQDSEKRERVLAILGSGDFFGEVSLLDCQHTGASVIAESACSVLEISKTAFATLVKKHPSIAETLKEYSTRRALDSKLANVKLFQDLNSMERQKIADFLFPLTAKQGTLIINEGEFGDCMYLIKTGTVGVYTRLMLGGENTNNFIDIEQQQLHLATLQDGDFFGEQALITSERRNATVMALTDVQLLRFAKPDLEAIIQTYPRVADLLKRYHHQRTSDTMESLHTAFQQLMTQHRPETM